MRAITALDFARESAHLPLMSALRCRVSSPRKGSQTGPKVPTFTQGFRGATRRTTCNRPRCRGLHGGMMPAGKLCP